MKKLYITFTTILFLSAYIFMQGSVSYCNEKTDTPNKIISNYLYDSLSAISSDINLTSKTILTSNCGDSTSNKDKYIKDIRYTLSTINSLISKSSTELVEYKDDKNITTALSAIQLILNEYRFSLILLEDYLLTEVADEKYGNLQTFFNLKTEGDRKLNTAKSTYSR